MWSFEVLADITSMRSLYCNSTKNRNNNITMILTLNPISAGGGGWVESTP